uniref:Uncharacterized protein n=1 Tax=Photinus pyralis TaxID=7054 RepID=A0A1Y1KJL4_PHOPY
MNKKERDKDNQLQYQINEIENSTYNYTTYKEIKTLHLPKYLQKNKNIKTIARFRCGNENRTGKRWKEEKCRLCKEETETIEHVIYLQMQQSQDKQNSKGNIIGRWKRNRLDRKDVVEQRGSEKRGSEKRGIRINIM